jgi:hypothetical protein
LFFSRRIGLHEDGTVPILAGARLTGKTGPYSIGLLDIETRAVSSFGVPATNFGVVRMKRDVLRQSSIGVMFTNRSAAVDGGGAAQTYGIDGGFSFFRNLSINTYWAQTKTPGVRDGDTSYRAQMQYDGDRYGAEVEHLTVGRNFSPEVGFLRRSDFRRNFAQLRFSPLPASPSRVRKYQFEASIDQFSNSAGHVETREVQGSFGIDFQSGDEWRVEATENYELLDEQFEIEDGIVLPVGGYRFRELQTRFQIAPQHTLSGWLNASAGSFYNGTRRQVGYRGRIELSPRLGLEPGVSWNWVDLEQGSFVAKLVSLRVSLNLSPRMAFAALTQYSSASDRLSANIRFRWEYQPGSDLFVVYNEGRDTSLPGRFPGLANRALIVRITRLVRF